MSRTDVQRAVLDATAAEGTPSMESGEALLRYLATPELVDIVYEEVIDRIGTAASDPLVLLRCIKLLKFVGKYVPSVPVLQKLDGLCATLAHAHEGSAVHATIEKSAHLIRSSIAKALTSPRPSTASGEAMADAAHTSSASLPTVDVFSTSPTPDSVAATLAAASTGSADAGAATAPAPLPPRLVAPFAPALPLDRLPGFPGTGPPRTLHAAPMLYPQFGSLSAPASGVFVRSDSELDALNRQLLVVATARQKAPARPRRPIFQYRYYTEQQPLLLPDDIVDAVVDTACASPAAVAQIGSADAAGGSPAAVVRPRRSAGAADLSQASIGAEAQQHASLLFTKLCMDGFCAAEPTMELLVSLLVGMVQDADAARRAHAFSVLFNIAMHTLLVADITTVEGGGRAEAILESLFRQLVDLLAALLVRNESEPVVWTAALNTYLLFSARNPLRARTLDVQIMVQLVLHCCPAAGPHVEDTLVTTLTAALRGGREGDPLDFSAIDRAGGIAVVSELYARARAVRAQSLLYDVIFDWVLGELSRAGQMSVTLERQEELRETLRLFAAPTALSALFAHVPDKFVERFVLYVFVDCMRHSPEWSAVAARQDKTFVVAVLYGIEALAAARNRVSERWLARVENTLMDVAGRSDDLSDLRSLLFSAAESDRRDGVLWLAALLRSNHMAASHLFASLALAPSPATRQCYVQVTERLVSYHCSRGDVASALRVLNERLSRLCALRERAEANLQAVADVVLRLVCMPVLDDRQEAPVGASLAALLLRGRAQPSLTVLAELSAGILLHLVLNLGHQGALDVRRAIMLLLCERGRVRAVLDTIGGPPVLEALMNDADPFVAFHAASTLLALLRSDEPDRFRQAMARLTAMAQRTNDSSLVDNAYVQMRAILGMTL